MPIKTKRCRNHALKVFTKFPIHFDRLQTIILVSDLPMIIKKHPLLKYYADWNQTLQERCFEDLQQTFLI